jgi:hypothetical protein
MALLMVGIGAFFFLATRESWVVPLTLATYAALVLLAIGDPIFQNRVLGTTQQGRRIPQAPQRPNSPPEQRTRRLPRGETRLRVERALEAHARVLVAVEESDEATQAALHDALPKLRQVPERLLDVAEAREKAAAAAQTCGGRVPLAPATREALGRSRVSRRSCAPPMESSPPYPTSFSRFAQRSFAPPSRAATRSRSVQPNSTKPSTR